jgi:hypothetical protein
LAYFDAIEAFGVETIAISSFESDSKLRFIQTHLTGCAKEKNTQIFRELIQIISSKSDSYKGFPMPHNRLQKVIHFKLDKEDSIFGKTALNWAIENSDQYMVMELLKLEHDLHKSEKEGLECLRDNLSTHELQPWIFETYSRFYNKKQYWHSFRTVIVELVLLSYLPFFIDIYSDIALAVSYNKYASENFNMTELWQCGDITLNSSCFPRKNSENAAKNHTDPLLGFEDVRHSFNVAFWVTICLLIGTIIVYIFSITFDSCPAWWTACLGKRQGWWLKVLHIVACKLLWPCISCAQQLMYLTSPKHNQNKDYIHKNIAVWNNIKIVEYGLESSIQLLLQLWLLRPSLPVIMTWSIEEMKNRSASGFAYFFTFATRPTCYVDKALAKILLAIIFLGLGISQTKRKPGQALKNTLPMFISIVAQTVGRLVALRSLVLTTSLGNNKYALFFISHFLLVFLIKIFFEVNSLRDKIKDCYQSSGRSIRVWEVLRFITSGLSSTIVMIYLGRGQTKDGHKHHPTFLSHSAFQVLILVENLSLVCLPYIAKDCFPAYSQGYAIWIVILAWYLGTLTQSIHYKYCSPFARVYGPQVSSWLLPVQISCLATLCWKREIHLIEVHGFCQLTRRDIR